MFDATYFKKQIDHDVAAAGGPIVEVVLQNGHTYRARSVLDVTDGYVTLEIYHMKGDLAARHPHWERAAGKNAATPGTTSRAVVSYESIAAVLVSPDQVEERAVGFAR